MLAGDPDPVASFIFRYVRDYVKHLTVQAYNMDGQKVDQMISCSLNGTVVWLPTDLCSDQQVFNSVLSVETWNSLSDEEKLHLNKFLPQFPSNCEDNQQETIKSVLSNIGYFEHNQPRKKLFDKIRAGRLEPEFVHHWEACQKEKFNAHKLEHRQYLQKLLKQLISKRKALLQEAIHSGSNPYQNNRPLFKSKSSTEREQRAKKRYNDIMKTIKSSVKDTSLSSDEETHSVTNDVSKSKMTLSDDAYMTLLYQHKVNRRNHKNHPDFDTSGISLTDIISRVNPKQKNASKKQQKNMKQIMKDKKNKKGLNSKQKPKSNKAASVMIKKDLSSAIDTFGQDSKRNEDSGEVVISKADAKGVAKQAPILSSLREPSQMYLNQKPSCFFAVIRMLFKETEEWSDTLIELEKRLFEWECAASTSDNPWLEEQTSWTDLLSPALEYLSGEGKATLLNDFVPLALLDTESNEWRWTGVDHDDEAILKPLNDFWLETIKNGNDDDTPWDETITVVDRTSYVVRPSSHDEKLVFREQEQQRYENPHKPFVYTMHGFQSTVGPVKGVYHKESGVSKAREHALLVSNRPAYVTILSLVRDAVARLPNGEGTRAEVCETLKDSQFINPKSTDAQIHGVVSGALDRLHAEKDACVKYEVGRKVWIYLHKNRTNEQFDLLHQACSAAAQAKKQFHQKQKSVKQKKALQELVSNQEKAVSRKRKLAKKKVPSSTSYQRKPDTDATPVEKDPISPPPPKQQQILPTTKPLVATTLGESATKTGVSAPLSLKVRLNTASSPSQTLPASNSNVNLMPNIISPGAAPRSLSPSLPGFKGTKLTIGYLQSLGYGTSKQTVRFDLNQLRTALEKGQQDSPKHPPESDDGMS